MEPGGRLAGLEGLLMLEQLLAQLRQGGTYSVSALARQFAVSEALMAAMLAGAGPPSNMPISPIDSPF